MDRRFVEIQKGTYIENKKDDLKMAVIIHSVSLFFYQQKLANLFHAQQSVFVLSVIPSDSLSFLSFFDFINGVVY